MAERSEGPPSVTRHKGAHGSQTTYSCPEDTIRDSREGQNASPSSEGELPSQKTKSRLKKAPGLSGGMSEGREAAQTPLAPVLPPRPAPPGTRPLSAAATRPPARCPSVKVRLSGEADRRETSPPNRPTPAPHASAEGAPSQGALFPEGTPASVQWGLLQEGVPPTAWLFSGEHVCLWACG